ncbi:C-C motif chemokine 18-like isoform X2 [Pagrus major]|uniref:C-C motif chemokine 18-like isoform X2 n=1 Tax=Pagrus major TaxID=143350 RepID=UPI003CC8DD96
MKTLLTFALLALICLLHHISAVAPGFDKQLCCEKVTETLVPRGKIQNVVRSNSKCQVTSIIVTTVCNVQICFDDSLKWAKKLLADFEKSTANTTSPSSPFNRSPCGNQTSKA